MAFCTKCGNQLDEDAKFCTKCGTPAYIAASNLCAGCGQTLVDGANFCTKCGTKADAVSQQVATPMPQPVPVAEVVPVAAQKLASWKTAGEQRSVFQMSTVMQKLNQSEYFAEIPRLVAQYPKALEYFCVEKSTAVSALPELLLQRIIWRTLPLELQKETPEPVLYLAPYVELQAKDPQLKAIDDNPMMKGMKDFTERMEGRLLIPRKKAPKDSSVTTKQLTPLEYKAFIAMEEWAIKKIVYDGLVAMCDALQFAQEFAEGQTFSSAYQSGAFEEEMKTLTSGLAMEVWFSQGTRKLWGPVIPNAQHERILNEPILEYMVRDSLKRICKKLDLDYNEISSKGAYKASYSIWWGGGGFTGALTGFSLLGKALDESSFKDAMAFVAYNTVVEKFNATYPAT